MNIEWKLAGDSTEFTTWTAEVPGGFLIKTTDRGVDSISTSVIFVAY